MSRPLLIGNWKLYLSPAKSVAVATALRRSVPHTPRVTCVVCPSFSSLPLVAPALKRTDIVLGAQDVGLESAGASTGGIAAADLKALGCRYVIIGHSERRATGETDAITAQKLAVAQAAGLLPILCIGESLAIRRRGKAKAFVLQQLRRSMARWTKGNLVVAYEPVWAISGHGNRGICTPDDALTMAQAIQGVLKTRKRRQGVRVLYGGSVTAATIARYVDGKRIHGCLVGRASTYAAEYGRMVKALTR